MPSQAFDVAHAVAGVAARTETGIEATTGMADVAGSPAETAAGTGTGTAVANGTETVTGAATGTEIGTGTGTVTGAAAAGAAVAGTLAGTETGTETGRVVAEMWEKWDESRLFHCSRLADTPRTPLCSCACWKREYFECGTKDIMFPAPIWKAGGLV